VQRSENGCDMRKCRSFNHSTCKTVLNLLYRVDDLFETSEDCILQRVTVVKFGGDSTKSSVNSNHCQVTVACVPQGELISFPVVDGETHCIAVHQTAYEGCA